MVIRRIDIHGLRGFAEMDGFDLAVPHKLPGSGLTTIVGPNNSGKSTIIEAFTAMSRRASQTPPSFTQGKRNTRAGDRVTVRVTNKDGAKVELKTAFAGGSETVWDPPPCQPVTAMTNDNLVPPIFVLPPRRTFSPYFGKSSARRDEYLQNYPPPELRSPTMDSFYTRLFNIQRDAKTRKAFGNLLRKVLGYDLNWVIDRDDHSQYFMKLGTHDAYHSSEGLGEGLISLIFIVDALYDSNKGDVVVIDEPESSLHPSVQRKLYGLLAEYAATRQVVIATHSPYFLGPETILNGGKIVRATKRGGKTVLFSLSEASISSIEAIIKDTHNPHGFGLDAREVFFLEERVILVEGLEDVIFYKKIAEQLHLLIEGTFFGWGVGGAGKMEKIAHLLRDLGFEHVVGILDKHSAPQKKALEERFPSYCFLVNPADDVRSKPARKETKAVHGLVEHDGTLCDEFRDEASRLLSEVNAALNPIRTRRSRIA